MDSSFRDFVLDQLGKLGGMAGAVCRPMFGGYGIYAGDAFFAIIFRGRFYFRTDESSRPAYVNQNMKPFRPRAGVALRAYYEVPADVLEDADQLVEWARVAIACVPPARRGSRRSRE